MLPSKLARKEIEAARISANPCFVGKDRTKIGSRRLLSISLRFQGVECERASRYCAARSALIVHAFREEENYTSVSPNASSACADGAALIYTSAKDGVNCGLLHRYLLSCLYPEAFSCSDEGQVGMALTLTRPPQWLSFDPLVFVIQPGSLFRTYRSRNWRGIAFSSSLHLALSSHGFRVDMLFANRLIYQSNTPNVADNGVPSA